MSIFVIVFDLDLVCRSSEKAAGGGGEVEEDIQLPPPDAQFNKDSSSSSATAAHKKSKREKKHKKQKPYSKRPSKIQHLDPIFICKFRHTMIYVKFQVIKHSAQVPVPHCSLKSHTLNNFENKTLNRRLGLP